MTFSPKTIEEFQRSFSPYAVGVIHFVGIGGIGMSGIAEILHQRGYRVQGSDLAEGGNVKRLRALGIPIQIGHRAENLGDAGVVVISSAVKADNPEVLAAREAFLPVVRRAEMLGELMRLKWSVAVAGTHGKTTTTSMVATLLETAEMDPTVINGGIINDYGTNARLGAGDWMVVEADESDGSFTKLPATVCIVTNMDPEHLDHYKDFEGEKAAFTTFIENIPFYGFAVLCLDHPEVQSLIPRISDRKIITYGLSPMADVRALDVAPSPDGTRFSVCLTDRKTGTARTVPDVFLPVIGQHNVLNALAALSVAWQLGLSDETMRKALARFSGVKRRFTRVGVVGGIHLIDDYGHHPIEIMATLKAAVQAKGGKGRIIAVMQPHRYTRLASLFNMFCQSFNDADSVYVADVYPAGEQPIDGATKEALVEGLRAHGHRDAHVLPSADALPQVIASIAKPDDYVVFLGAGNISAWAHALPEPLEKALAAQTKLSA